MLYLIPSVRYVFGHEKGLCIAGWTNDAAYKLEPVQMITHEDNATKILKLTRMLY